MDFALSSTDVLGSYFKYRSFLETVSPSTGDFFTELQTNVETNAVLVDPLLSYLEIPGYE